MEFTEPRRPEQGRADSLFLWATEKTLATLLSAPAGLKQLCPRPHSLAALPRHFPSHTHVGKNPAHFFVVCLDLESATVSAQTLLAAAGERRSSTSGGASPDNVSPSMNPDATAPRGARGRA